MDWSIGWQGAYEHYLAKYTEAEPFWSHDKIQAEARKGASKVMDHAIIMWEQNKAAARAAHPTATETENEREAARLSEMRAKYNSGGFKIKSLAWVLPDGTRIQSE